MSEIIILGDIAFNGILSTEPEKNKKRFKNISPILNKSEIVFANLEVPLKVDDTKNEYKNIIHYSSPEPTEQLLKMFNIGCVSLANNHIYDCKMPGLKATISLLDKLCIHHTGAGWLPEHIEPAIIEQEQQNIGFLSYVDQSTNPKTKNFPELYINYFTKEKVLNDIKKIKSSVDKIIVSIHWGVDYSHYQTPRQITIAHDLINAGVDIIMGHHPHTLQPFEKYKDDLNIYLKELIYGYAKDKFKKVEEFEVGEKVIWVVFDEKVEIRGFSSENIPIIEDNLGNVHKVKLNRLSKLKSKDELEKGDKFIGKTGTEYEVVAREYDERSSMMKYFVKRDKNNKKVIGIVSEISIEEVIV